MTDKHNNQKDPGTIKTSCTRCGICCKKGGPSIHIEDQAINRAHRIGSSGPVTITRFVTPGTIEQRIDDILTRKRELMQTILDNQDGPRQTGLSRDEIFGLFDLKIA